MKLFAAVLTASALAIPGIASAAAATAALTVHVPFSFVMAGQEFAAGDYRVQQNDNGIVCLQGSGKSVMALSVPSTARPGAAPGLQFASKDSREHLVGIQLDGSLRSLPIESEAGNKLTVASVR